MEISITSQNTFNQTSIFSKNWCNFHIDQSKWRLVKCQLKFSLRYGPEKKLYRATLNFSAPTYITGWRRKALWERCFAQERNAEIPARARAWALDQGSTRSSVPAGANHMVPGDNSLALIRRNVSQSAAACLLKSSLSSGFWDWRWPKLPVTLHGILLNQWIAKQHRPRCMEPLGKHCL